MKERKFYNKFKEAKARLKEHKTILRCILGCIRWFATIIVTYSFTAAAIVSVIPFTTSYLAGVAQISKTTDLVSGFIMWGFPSLAATLIITALVMWIDVQIYKLFKKWLSYDGMKETAETVDSKTEQFNGSTVRQFSSKKNRKAK